MSKPTPTERASRATAQGDIYHEAQQLAKELEHLKKNEDRRIDRLCYRGNTVGYIYDKLENYKKVIGDCCAHFKMDGNTSVVDLIGKQKAELEQSKKREKELREIAEYLSEDLTDFAPRMHFGCNSLDNWRTWKKENPPT